MLADKLALRVEADQLPLRTKEVPDTKPFLSPSLRPLQPTNKKAAIGKARAHPSCASGLSSLKLRLQCVPARKRLPAASPPVFISIVLCNSATFTRTFSFQPLRYVAHAERMDISLRLDRQLLLRLRKIEQVDEHRRALPFFMMLRRGSPTFPCRFTCFSLELDGGTREPS
jgi:hypothetical protein